MRLEKAGKIRVMGRYPMINRSNPLLVAQPLPQLFFRAQRHSLQPPRRLKQGKHDRPPAARIAHTSHTSRRHLTTVLRSQPSARQIIQSYRLRWLVELFVPRNQASRPLRQSFSATEMSFRRCLTAPCLRTSWCAPCASKPHPTTKSHSNSSAHWPAFTSRELRTRCRRRLGRDYRLDPHLSRYWPRAGYARSRAQTVRVTTAICPDPWCNRA
jgi:hypothetical protein